nr:hypothetical protein [Tanacetum cinerariifolium]
ALDEALVPHASRLRIGKSNLRLRSDITSKESNLQLVYDVLRLTPFYKAFLVTTNVPEIYIQEFWATATVHHHSIRFKMNNKKRIVNLKYFRKMLYICPRLPNQTFDELSFKEEILAFLRYLGYNGEIRKLTDEDFVYQVEHKEAKKSNEMYYPRFTKVIIDFFMTKDPSIPRRNKVNSHYVRDDQMFTMIKLVSRHQNTQQFDAILPIELTNKDIKNSAAYKEYYVVASGAAPPKTKASVRKTQSSFDTTITPPTAASTRISTLAKGKQPAKFSKAKDEGTSIIPGVPDVPTDEDDDDEVDERSDDQEDEDDQDDDDDDDQDDDNQDDNDDDQDTNNDDDDFVHPKLSIHEEEAKDEESFDPIVQTPENSDDEGNDDASLGLIVGGEKGQDAEDDDKELYRDVNINLEGRDVQMTDVHTTQEFEDTHVTLTLVNPDGQQQTSSMSSQFVTRMLNPSPDTGIDSLFESTPRVDVQASTTVAPLTLTAPTLPPPTIPTIYQVSQAPTPPTTAPSTFMQDLLNFGSLFRFDHHTLTPELLAGPTYELMKGSCKSLVELEFFLEEVYKATFDQLDCRRVIPFDNFIKNDLEYLRGGASSHKYTTSITKTKAEIMGTSSGLKTWESARDAYSKRRIITVTELQIVKWHNYKHLDWITVRRDDDKLYKFKEDDFKRLRIQDIEDMLLFLVQGKLTNLTVEECFTFNVSLRMFIKSIVIQRRVEDLKLGVKSYQKKLNLTKPDTYRSDLKHKEAYTAYSNPRGFIYQNKHKQNRLMWIDELHKFNDGTLIDVRTTLDDHLKHIWMKYLPQDI